VHQEKDVVSYINTNSFQCVACLVHQFLVLFISESAISVDESDMVAPSFSHVAVDEIVRGIVENIHF